VCTRIGFPAAHILLPENVQPREIAVRLQQLHQPGGPAPEAGFYAVFEVPMWSSNWALFQFVPEAGEVLRPEDLDQIAAAYRNGPDPEAQSWMLKELRWIEKGHPLPKY